MLAQSDRAGCATGAAIALVLDWRAIRACSMPPRERFGVDAARARLPDARDR